METEAPKRPMEARGVTRVEDTCTDKCCLGRKSDDPTEDALWDGQDEDWDLYMERLLPAFSELAKPLSASPKNEAAGRIKTPNKHLLLESFEKTREALQRMSETRAQFVEEMLEMEKNDWRGGLDEPNKTELDEGERVNLWRKYGLNELENVPLGAVLPSLKKIKYFRQCIVNGEFEKANDVLSDILENAKRPRDIMNSMSRIVTVEIEDHVGSPNPHLSKLKNLKKKLQSLIEKELSNPVDINNVFKQNNWYAIKKVFETHSDKLSKEHLNQVILMAARTRSWPLFWSCVERGADIVYTGSMPPCTASCPTSLQDMEMNTDGPTDCKRSKMVPPVTGVSPLHEALKTGELLLEKLDEVFKNNPSLANAVDETGDCLLHLVVLHGLPDTRQKNIQFLLKHKVNVNTTNVKGKTALHYMLHSRFSSWEANLIVEIVLGTDCDIAKHTWQAGSHEWTALHVLCATGLHQHIAPFVQKGANPEDLRYGLTLVDTVILQDGMARDLKEKTLTALLQPPIQLGPFHARTVKARSSLAAIQQQRKYQRFLINGKNYLYPIERLLFPLVSTLTIRAAYRQFIRVMLEGGAVCDEELRFVESKLHLVREGDMELRDYLQPFLEELNLRDTCLTTDK